MGVARRGQRSAVWALIPFRLGIGAIRFSFAMSFASRLKVIAGSAAACGSVYAGWRYLSDKPVSVREGFCFQGGAPPGVFARLQRPGLQLLLCIYLYNHCQ